MSDSKNVGNAWENAFKKMCNLQDIAVTQIHDGFQRIGNGGLLPKKQACDFILSYKGKTALVDAKTQQDGQTFEKYHVDPNQLDKMRPHRKQGVDCGYLVYFRNEDKIIYFDLYLLDFDKRHMKFGLDLGPITGSNIKKIFTAEQKQKPQEKFR